MIPSDISFSIANNILLAKLGNIFVRLRTNLAIYLFSFFLVDFQFLHS
jgi:hypothetical protein